MAQNIKRTQPPFSCLSEIPSRNLTMDSEDERMENLMMGMIT